MSYVTWTIGGATITELSGRVATPPKAATVTMRQARLALHGAGLLAGVQAAIDAMSEPMKTQAQITWDHSQEVQRDQPFVALLGAALGLDGAGIDALFEQAILL